MNKDIAPDISVVMSTKDRGHIIKESIQSIIKQSLLNWELIIIDDHSQELDQTKQIIAKINDPRIKYFKLPDANGSGIAAARNYGNMLAQAKFIAVMDSDDIALPDRLKLTLDYFKKEKPDVVYARMLMWDPEQNVLTKRKPEFYERRFDLDYFKKYNFIPHSTVSYKKEVALEFPYNTAFRRASDYDLLSRLAIHNYKFSFIDEVLLHYRVHEGSISKIKIDINYPNLVRKNRGWL